MPLHTEGAEPCRLLCVIAASSHFQEFLQIARSLKADPRFHVSFCFLGRYVGVERDEDLCARDGFGLEEWARSPDEVDPDPTATQARVVRHRRPLPWLTNRAARGILGPMYRFAFRAARWLRDEQVRTMIRLKKLVPTEWRQRSLMSQLAARRTQKTLARWLVERARPNVVLLAEDHVESFAPAIIAAAHASRAAAVVVPYTLANATEPAESYWHNSAYWVKGPMNRLAARLYPRWVYEHRGRRLMRLPWPCVFATEWSGLAPALPWQLNSGHADLICVESDAIRDYFVRAGLSPDVVVATGSAQLDTIAAHAACAGRERAELLRELGLPDSGRLVLCALPPDQLDVRAHACEFKTFAELASFWVGRLLEIPDANVILALHPRTKRETVAHLVGPRVAIATRPTSTLVPLCDLFVASVSATIRWAIACGKPTINYDVYRYRYDDYLGVPGVVAMEATDEFRAAISRIATDPAALPDLARKQQSAAEHWGKLDARGVARLAERFLALSKQK
ncbi:MAG: hypothetical protein SFY96_11635 [Planctomycetota bacterium]|nr:hypothetical protein [Planctomycetota bacterium]